MSPRILIVGGGIAGLTLGAALGMRDIRATLVERAPQWSPVGSGIGLGLNAVLALKEIAAAEAVMERGAPSMYWEITDRAGRLLTRFDYHQLYRRFGVTVVCIHRAALHDVLLELNGATDIRLGTTPEAVRLVGDEVSVDFSSGESATYDLVVGADGIRSGVRDLVFGPARSRYLGYTSQRVMVRRPPGIERLIEMWGRGRRVGIAATDPETLYCYATINAPPNGDADGDPAGRLEAFHRDFAGFGGFMPDVLAQVEDPGQLFRTDLEEVVGQEWRREGVVLIGDAAHAMTPDLGQGGAMAIEDAIALADSLGASGGRVEAALADFLARRYDHATAVQKRSRRFGRIGQLDGRVTSAVRNAAVRATGRRGIERLMMPRGRRGQARARRPGGGERSAGFSATDSGAGDASVR